MNISNVSFQDGGHSLDSMQRACTLEAELAFLLRISNKYGKSGAQVLLSMGALEHISLSKAVSMQGSRRLVDSKNRSYIAAEVDKQRMVVTPILRLVFSLTSLVEKSDIFEVKNKIVREIIDFVRGHQLLFDQVLRQDISAGDELTIEQINLVVGILSKVWPYEEIDVHGFVQALFAMMRDLFSLESGVPSFAQQSQKKSELSSFRLSFSLMSYLYFLVTKKMLRLQVSDGGDYHTAAASLQPTLTLLASLLNSVTSALERAAEEKSLLLIKIQNINELSRQEVDEIINMCLQRDTLSAYDNLQKRRYIAMVEMCRIAGNKDQLITLLLPLAEQVLNVLLIHFQDSSLSSDATGTSGAITYGSKSNSAQDVSPLCEELIPILERLELLNEEKIGSNLKVFHRLVSSLKEMMIEKLSS